MNRIDFNTIDCLAGLTIQQRKIAGDNLAANNEMDAANPWIFIRFEKNFE